MWSVALTASFRSIAVDAHLMNMRRCVRVHAQTGPVPTEFGQMTAMKLRFTFNHNQIVRTVDRTAVELDKQRSPN